jgi:putative inorganic carbon (hco3(-)) transporter
VATSLSHAAESGSEFSSRLQTATAWLTGLSSVAVLFSIAASQILLGAALASLLLSRKTVDLPRHLRGPLAAYVLWTLLALGFSDDPAAGLSQIRKLFVFFVLVVVASGFQNQRQIWRTVEGVMLGGTVAALYGLVQFFRDYMALQHQGEPFYSNYVVHQITGFMGHWMTFGGQLMQVLLLLLAVLLFATQCGRLGWRWLGVFVIGLALLGAFTRGIWIGTLAGATYLIGCRRRWMVALIPVLVLFLYFVSPSWLQQRDKSIFNPEQDSSSMSRLVMLRVGLRMISAHPLFGLGPERVGVEFHNYVPPDTKLPPAWYGHLHNDYLQTAAERGIPCLIILLWIFYEVLRDGALHLRKGAISVERALACAAIAATIGLMVGGLVEYNWGDSEVVMLYLFVISLPYAWSRNQPSNHTPLPELAPAQAR